MSNPYMREGRCVYFVQAGETDKVKIGYTANGIRSRMVALQIGSGEILKRIGVLPGFPKTEKFLHMMFAADRLHHEWFTLSEQMVDFLSRMERYPEYMDIK